MHSFISDNPTWNESMIRDRASMMAETFYHSILERDTATAAPGGTATDKTNTSTKIMIEENDDH